MIRRRRRNVFIPSDTSNDDRTQSSNNVLPRRNSRKRQVQQKDSNSASSDSSTAVRTPRKQRRTLHISSSEDSSSNEAEELIHPTRRGALRALSDYETGDSINTLSWTSRNQIIRKREEDDSSESSALPSQRRLLKKLSISSSEDSGSEEILQPPKRKFVRALSDYETGDSADNRVQPPRLPEFNVRERPPVSSHKNEETPIYDLESYEISPGSDQGEQQNPNNCLNLSDNDLPLGYLRKKKRLRLVESDSEDLCENEPNPETTRNISSVEISNRAGTNNVNSSGSQHSMEHISGIQEAFSNNSPISRDRRLPTFHIENETNIRTNNRVTLANLNSTSMHNDNSSGRQPRRRTRNNNQDATLNNSLRSRQRSLAVVQNDMLSESADSSEDEPNIRVTRNRIIAEHPNRFSTNHESSSSRQQTGRQLRPRNSQESTSNNSPSRVVRRLPVVLNENDFSDVEDSSEDETIRITRNRVSLERSIRFRTFRANNDDFSSSYTSMQMRNRNDTREPTSSINSSRLATDSEYELSDSESSDEDEPNIRITRNRISLVRPSISRLNSLWEEASRRIRNQRNAQENSQNNLSGGAHNEDELSSDGDIRPRALRHHRMPFFASDSGSNVSSDESVPVVRNSVRRGALVALYESSEEEGALNPSGINVNKPEEVAAPSKSGDGSSSDEDEESERCPICLARFKLQEVGRPGSCDHSFCLKCIQEWSKNNNTCPVDRQTFTSITVMTHREGLVSREIQVGPPPVRTFWEDEWWETVEGNIVFANEEVRSTSPSEYDSDGDGPDEVCCVCYRGNPNDDLIICDYCNNVYHLYCLNPPLQYLPAGDWFCPSCVELEWSDD